MNHIDIIILLFIYINTAIIGYVIGRYKTYQNNGVNNNRSFLRTINSEQQSQVSIDDAKFVVDIKTDNFEKKYDTLGDIKHSNEDISNSVNKLKNLKR